MAISHTHRSCEGRNLPFPIMLAVGLHNSLYCRARPWQTVIYASRRNHGCKKGILGMDTGKSLLNVRNVIIFMQLKSMSTFHTPVDMYISCRTAKINNHSSPYR